jgi:hypothetical protein
MRNLFLVLISISVLSAFGSSRTKSKTAPPVEETPPPVQMVPIAVDVFSTPLPLVIGPLPTGLANASVQACAACHTSQVSSWQEGAHNSGLPSSLLIEAAIESSDPTCLHCHLPLSEQYPSADGTPTSNFQPTLRLEGVTCATCHLRDGAVISSKPHEAGSSPHALATSPTLGTSKSCAACHQYTSPGAATPLYDTYGEWSRSEYATAGISCQDCHMHKESEGSHASHNPTAKTGTGVSLLLSASSLAITRGGPPLDTIIILQNTGAGHAMPTASPYKRWVVMGSIAGPKGTIEPIFSQTLGQTVSQQAPWQILEDTRIGPQEERRWAWNVALPVTAKSGTYALVLEIQEQHSGDPKEHRTILSQRYPLRVD